MATTFNYFAMPCIGVDEVRGVNVVVFINATLSRKKQRDKVTLQPSTNHQGNKFGANERSKKVCYDGRKQSKAV